MARRRRLTVVPACSYDVAHPLRTQSDRYFRTELGRAHSIILTAARNLPAPVGPNPHALAEASGTTTARPSRVSISAQLTRSPCFAGQAAVEEMCTLAPPPPWRRPKEEEDEGEEEDGGEEGAAADEADEAAAISM